MMACTLPEYQQSILASGLNSPREGPSSLILNKTSRRSLLRLERLSVLTRFIRENTRLSLAFVNGHIKKGRKYPKRFYILFVFLTVRGRKE